MQAIFQGCRHTEIAATTTCGPEQIGVLMLTGGDDASVRQDEVDRQEIVQRQRMLAHQPAEPAAQCETCDTRARNCTASNRQAMQLSFAIEFSPRNARLGTCRPAHRIDMDALHRGKVDHHAAIDRCAPRHIVTAAANGGLETEPLRNADSVGDVGHAATPGDQRRTLVDQAIVNPSGFFIGRVAWPEQLSRKCRAELSGSIHDVQCHGSAPSDGCPDHFRLAHLVQMRRFQLQMNMVHLKWRDAEAPAPYRATCLRGGGATHELQEGSR